MLIHCYLTLKVFSNPLLTVSSVTQVWPVTNLIRRLGIVFIFFYRLPVLIPLSTLLITQLCLPRWCFIVSSTIILLSIWILMGQTILTRITFGSFDKYFRHWVTIIPWKNRNNSLPIIPKRVALRDIALSLIGFTFLAIIGYAGVFFTIYHLDPNAFTGKINGYSDFLYFSTVTFATVGYGDISPLSQLARLLVVTEIFVSVGTFVMLLLTYSLTKDDDE